MTKRKRRHRRSVEVRINGLQPHAEDFKDRLDERNYTPATIIEVVRLLALWADWDRAKGFELETLDAGLAASASVFRGSKKARAPQGAAKLFITYLRNEGVLPPVHKPSLGETWPELAAFRHGRIRVVDLGKKSGAAVAARAVEASADPGQISP